MVERYEEAVTLSREAQRNNDAHLFGYLAEVGGLAMLGREEEAAQALTRLRKVQPVISIAFVEQSLPMAESDGKHRFLRGLALAGMK